LALAVSHGDRLRDDPAMTKSEITEHSDGVRWSFVSGDGCG